MPDAVESYWGTDFPPANDSVAVALLRQQASKLADVTQGAVEGVVKEAAEGGTIFASLYAAVPAAGEYEFKILYIAHPIVADPVNPFPITVEDSFEKTKYSMPDMPTFDDYLRKLLSSKPVRTAISNLIKYSQRRRVG